MGAPLLLKRITDDGTMATNYRLQRASTQGESTMSGEAYRQLDARRTKEIGSQTSRRTLERRKYPAFAAQIFEFEFSSAVKRAVGRAMSPVTTRMSWWYALCMTGTACPISPLSTLSSTIKTCR
jgi:hypothetical protein